MISNNAYHSTNHEGINMSELKQVYQAADGTTFNTKAEALDHQRAPEIRAALMTATQGNEELSQWLLDQKSELSDVFGTGTVQRVKKTERNKLAKALEAVAEAHPNEPKFRFLIENAEAITKTFKWPGQKRLDSDEKTAAIQEKLTEMLGDDNSEAAEWIAANVEAIETAYDAGKPKREPSAAAMEGLAKHRAKVKAEKEAAEA